MPKRTLVGAVVTGNAISLNGSNQNADRAIISGVTDNFTMSAWIYILSLPSATGAIFANGASDANGMTLEISSAGLFRVEYHFVAFVNSGSTLSLTTWYHVAAVRSSGSTQCYVNGVASGSSSASTPNSANSYSAIGSTVSSGRAYASYLNAYIDDVRFYERALSAGELTNLVSQATNPSLTVSSANLK